MMNKINVLVTVPHLTSTASPYREMIALAKYLPRDEFRLVICSLRKNGIEETGPYLKELGVQFFIAKFRIKQLNRIPDLIQANRLINENGPFHIQHSFDFSSTPLEAIIARINGYKFIHQQRNYNLGGHKSALWLKMLFSNKIIACSSGLKQFLETFWINKNKIMIIPNGLDLSNLEYQSEMLRIKQDHDVPRNAEYPQLLMVSNMVPLKRIQDGILAIRRIVPNYPRIKLKIIGAKYDSDYYDSLINLANENNLEKNIEFLGQLNNTEVLNQMLASDIFIHCSESEGFSWVLLEAFSSKLPVIAASSQGPSEIIEEGHNGFLFPVGSTDALADKLEYLLDHPELQKKLSKNAYQDIVQKYSAKSMVSQIAEIYRQLAS